MNNKKLYHVGVYMPMEIMEKATIQLRKADSKYNATFTKHFKEKLASNNKNRKFDMRNVRLKQVSKGEIVTVETVNDRILTVLVRLSVSDYDDLYLCIDINNKYRFITGYTHSKRVFNRQALINEGLYQINDMATI